MQYASVVEKLLKFINLKQRIMQGIGKAYNELKQGEPAIERLFDITRFESKVINDLIYHELIQNMPGNPSLPEYVSCFSHYSF